MRKRLPPLDSLRVLSTCVRHGNFSRAADELRVTPTAVSQRIRALEAELGVKLFTRRGPHLITTDQAKALGQRVEHALLQISTAVDACRRVKHPLRVTCAPTFAGRWLVPRLATYHVTSGADAITLDNSQALMATDDFDVAIRAGTGPWPGWNSVKLLSEQFTPMLSPKLMPSRPPNAKELLKIPLIPDSGWSAWFKAAGIANPKPIFASIRYPNYELEAQAAVQGAGVALLSRILFADLLTQGALIAPFQQVLEGRSDYWLLWSEEAADSHFVRWMKHQFGLASASDG
jgi:LysR family transcriptional regulator, glycine cleavage system transcriptional activator